MHINYIYSCIPICWISKFCLQKAQHLFSQLSCQRSLKLVLQMRVPRCTTESHFVPQKCWETPGKHHHMSSHVITFQWFLRKTPWISLIFCCGKLPCATPKFEELSGSRAWIHGKHIQGNQQTQTAPCSLPDRGMCYAQLFSALGTTCHIENQPFKWFSHIPISSHLFAELSQVLLQHMSSTKSTAVQTICSSLFGNCCGTRSESAACSATPTSRGHRWDLAARGDSSRWAACPHPTCGPRPWRSANL